MTGCLKGDPIKVISGGKSHTWLKVLSLTRGQLALSIFAEISALSNWDMSQWPSLPFLKSSQALSFSIWASASQSIVSMEQTVRPLFMCAAGTFNHLTCSDRWIDGGAGVMEGRVPATIDGWERINTANGGAGEVMVRSHTACVPATYDCLRKALLEKNAGGAHDVQHVAVLHQRTERVVKQLVFRILIVLTLLRSRPLQACHTPPPSIHRPLRGHSKLLLPKGWLRSNHVSQERKLRAAAVFCRHANTGQTAALHKPLSFRDDVSFPLWGWSSSWTILIIAWNQACQQGWISVIEEFSQISPFVYSTHPVCVFADPNPDCQNNNS